MRPLMLMAVSILGLAMPARAADAVAKVTPAPATGVAGLVSGGLIWLAAILLLIAFAVIGRMVHRARRRQERGRIRLR